MKLGWLQFSLCQVWPRLLKMWCGFLFVVVPGLNFKSHFSWSLVTAINMPTCVFLTCFFLNNWNKFISMSYPPLGVTCVGWLLKIGFPLAPGGEWLAQCGEASCLHMVNCGVTFKIPQTSFTSANKVDMVPSCGVVRCQRMFEGLNARLIIVCSREVNN